MISAYFVYFTTISCMLLDRLRNAKTPLRIIFDTNPDSSVGFNFDEFGELFFEAGQ